MVHVLHSDAHETKKNLVKTFTRLLYVSNYRFSEGRKIIANFCNNFVFIF